MTADASAESTTAESTAAPSPPRRTRRRRGEGVLLREEILDAADRLLFAGGGPSAVTIRAVSGAVGVTAPTLYRHFTDRDELLYQVCARRFAALDAHLEAAAAGVADPADELCRRGKAYIEFGLANPEAYKLLFMEDDHGLPWEGSDGWPDDKADPGASAFGHLLDNVVRAQAAGVLRDDDPYVVACTLFASLHGVTSAVIGMEHFPWPPLDTMVDHVLGALMRGLAPAD